VTLAHFIYIPGVLLVGIVLGYVLGGRAVETSRADKDARLRARAARKARAAAESPENSPENSSSQSASGPP
jgi:hypothetical protein